MKIVITGDDAKLKRLAKELNIRVKRDKLSMTLQEEKSKKAKANTDENTVTEKDIPKDVKDVNVNAPEEVKASTDEKDTKTKKKKNFLGL